MKTTIKAAGAIILSGLLLTGCSGQTKASQAKPSVEPQLTLLTKQVRSLYADSKYEMPAKDLSKVGLTKADNQKAKVYKLRGELSKAQQKNFQSESAAGHRSKTDSLSSGHTQRSVGQRSSP